MTTGPLSRPGVGAPTPNVDAPTGSARAEEAGPAAPPETGAGSTSGVVDALRGLGFLPLKRVDLEPSHLRSRAAALAPAVTEASGLDLDPSRVQLSVLEPRAFEALEARALGREPEPGVVASLTRAALKPRPLALMVPGEENQEVAFHAGTARAVSPSQVAEALAHELTHAAQAQTYPGFMAALSQARATARAAAEAHGGGSEAHRDALDTLHARQCFLEAHAVHVQKQLKPDHFPNGGLVGTSGGLLRLVLSLTAEGRGRLEQYVESERKIAALLDRHGPELLARLYAHPPLVDLLFKTRGAVELELPPGASPEQRRGLSRAVAELQAVRGEAGPEVQLVDHRRTYPPGRGDASGQ
jgi:hypothetical protein